eukprot:365594-Chlamydomonas_euryale.AAC.14
MFLVSPLGPVVPCNVFLVSPFCPTEQSRMRLALITGWHCQLWCRPSGHRVRSRGPQGGARLQRKPKRSRHFGAGEVRGPKPSTGRAAHRPVPSARPPARRPLPPGSPHRARAALPQLPLPRHIDEQTVLSAISVEKDVDGFHPLNIGRLCMKGREPLFVPCTPLGCMELLERCGIQIKVWGEGGECAI